MTKYIIATDLDGTLLKDHGELSSFSIDMINQFIQQGHLFVPCTSRSYTGLPESLSNLHFRYSICNNGSTIYDHQENKVVATFKLDTSAIQPILDIKHEAIKAITFVDQGVVYSQPIIFDLFKFYGFGKEKLEHTKKTRIIDEFTLEKLLQCPTIEKLHFNFLNQSQRDDFLKYIPESPKYQIASSCEQNIEITSFNASKGLALTYLLNELKLTHHPIIAFGDNLNDVPLFQVAHHKVALKNAVSGLKEFADDITSYTNDEDGEARYLLNYLNPMKKHS